MVEADHSSLRLAELVAALSLGIDLGFGQPMEHVLRQCLIALRLAERVGLDDIRPIGRLLHRAARQRRMSYRCPRASQVVRRRHQAEVHQVHPTDARRSQRRRRDPTARLGTPAPGSVPHRAGVRDLRSPGRRRHDRAPFGDGAEVGRRARPGRTGARRPVGRVRAVGREGVARRPGGRRHPHRRAAGTARGVRRGRAPRRRHRGGDRGGDQGTRRTVRPCARRSPRDGCRSDLRRPG